MSGELQGPELENGAPRASSPRIRRIRRRTSASATCCSNRDRCRGGHPCDFVLRSPRSCPPPTRIWVLQRVKTAQREFDEAAETLRAAERVEPGNPVVLANLGLVLSDGGKPQAAIDPLQRALTTDPNLHHARFALAIAFARAGRRADAARTAEELLRRLPANAPQRPEVQRLIESVR